MLDLSYRQSPLNFLGQTTTRFQGGVISTAAGQFPHIQFWAPTPVFGAGERRYVLDQIMLAIPDTGGTGVLNFVNVHRHAVALANLGAAVGASDVSQSQAANTQAAQLREEVAAAPIATLGTLVMTFPVVPVYPGPPAAPTVGMGQVLVIPVLWNSIFNGTNGLTFVTQNAALGLYVGFWWSEYRRNA